MGRVASMHFTTLLAHPKVCSCTTPLVYEAYLLKHVSKIRFHVYKHVFRMSLVQLIENIATSVIFDFANHDMIGI